MENNILQLFPIEKRGFWQETAKVQERIQEIRLRVGRPVIVMCSGREMFLNEQGQFTNLPENAYCAEEEEVSALFRHICHDSPYAFEDEIRQGFVTVEGGHRVGIAGQVVLDGETSVRTIKHISYMNIRISHQIKGAADKILSLVYENGKLKNTLIISPPGCGKTTLLRDLIRQVSDGNVYGEGMSVGLVDERSEIAGSYLGCPQNDVGMRTDVLDACPKALGMMLLLRSMSPRVIAVDEIGGREDMEALKLASACGSRVLATVHGDGVGDVIRKFDTYDQEEQLFECFIVLGKREGHPIVRQFCRKEEVYAAFCGRNHDCGRMPGAGTVVSRPHTGTSEYSAGTRQDSGDADQ